MRKVTLKFRFGGSTGQETQQPELVGGLPGFADPSFEK